MVVSMHISQATTQPSLLSQIQQIAGIAPPKRSAEKTAVSGQSASDEAKGQTASGTQTGTVQTTTSSQASTQQRGSVVNLLV